jgi:hypothetical protein
MWRLVFTLTLVGLALVAALPAAQQDGSLDSLIDETFPKRTTPQSVPQIGGDIDKLIQDVFSGNATISTTSRNLILGTQNQTPSKPDDCECVPYYQCRNGTIVSDGVSIIDIRSVSRMISIRKSRGKFYRSRKSLKADSLTNGDGSWHDVKLSASR